MSTQSSTSVPSGPGILYVNSKITRPNLLSSTTFTDWYEQVHIPDIFATSGIKTAFRYFTTSSQPENVDRPYLALYPLRDVAFLQTDEFKSIPVHSPMLPIESKAIFDLADFDTRYYLNVGMEETGEVGVDPMPYLATIAFDLPTELKEADDQTLRNWYLTNLSVDVPTRIRIYRLYFARQNRLSQEEKALGQPHEVLALHEFQMEEDLQTVQAPNGIKAEFQLLRAFGESHNNFF